MFGFRTSSPTKEEKITLKITGMHCPSCAMSVDDALEEIDGVVSSSTSYASGKVTISYDPQKVSVDLLMGTIRDCGYTPMPTA